MSYERFCEMVIFEKCKFAFSLFICASVITHHTEFAQEGIWNNSTYFGENQSALELTVS